MDGADLLAVCGDNLVYECNLVEGIARGDLSPFHYFGIPDPVDFRPIPWRNGRFDPAALTEAVETHQRAQRVWDEWVRRGRRRALGFCVSVTHARFMADVFTAIGRQSHSGQFTIAQRVALRALLAEEFALPYQEVRVAARRDPRS